MSKFSLNTLGKALSEKSSLSQTEAELFIRKMFDVCHQGLDTDKQVKMKWLGTFKVQAVKDRESIDVNTGERIIIEGRDKLAFTPDNILKEIINKPFAQFETVVLDDDVEFDDIDEKFEEKEVKFEEHEEETTPIQQVSEESPAAAETQIEETIKIEEPAVEIEEPAVQIEAPGNIEDEPEETKTSTSEVIDFLDETETAAPSSEVVVIGESTIEAKAPELEPEQKLEEKPEEKEPEVKEPEESLAKEPIMEEEEEVEEEEDRHHVVLPRSWVIAASIVLLALIGGIGWFAFSYGKMAAQRDHLALQLNEYHKEKAPVATKAPAAVSQEQRLRQKAKEDSIRMAQASEAVKAAEAKAKEEEKTQEEAQAKQEPKAPAAPAKKEPEPSKAEKPVSSSSYDSDPRVRTGAYRIVGVAQTITVSGGMTLEKISNRYLGPGMECYVEALNGTREVKDGQKIKIPKLELKKKKK